jgi:hypothetical protein
VKERFTGRLHRLNQEIDTEPGFQIDEAVTTVLGDIKKITHFKELSVKEKKILKYEAPACSLIILNQNDNSYTLAWECEVRPNFIER